MLPEAEIIFVPYNYLIDPLARRSIGISIENSILIFDEAHNVVRMRWWPAGNVWVVANCVFAGVTGIDS